MAFAVGIATGGSDDRPKRAWRPWYRLANPQSAICPTCNVPCIVKSTQKTGNCSTQYRACPQCGHTTQTTTR